MDTQNFIVDAKLNKSVERTLHTSQIKMLHSLYLGLRSLYDVIKEKENWAAENYPAPNLLQGYDYMNTGKVEPEFFEMLTNYHHWFSISVINYARLSGFLVGISNGDFTKEDRKTEGGKKKIKNSCNNYIEQVVELKHVKTYRNIVSAHFALTDPRKDNFMTMDISATNICGFINNRIVSKAGGYVQLDINEEISISGQPAKPTKQITTVEQIPIWSITQTFEELLPRYWPHIELPEDEYKLKKIAYGETLNFNN